MKLFVFQGTFNPIHNAHLRVCEYIKNKFDCGKILLIPAQNPPHKETDESLCLHRLNMVKLAVKNIPCLEVSDIEYKRKGASYTYYTIKELYRIYDVEGKINFIIGTDAFSKIETWHRAEELKGLVDFILFKRDDDKNFNLNLFEKLAKKGYNYTLMELPFKDISSTQIRNLAKHSIPIKGTVPPQVEEYINKHELYKI